jgi:uncharacterized protein
MSKIERRPNSVYGFGGTRKLRSILRRPDLGSYLCVASCVDPLEGRIPRHRQPSALWREHSPLRRGLVIRLFPGGTASKSTFLRGYFQYTLSRGLAGLYQVIFKTRHSAGPGFLDDRSFYLLDSLRTRPRQSNPGESPIGELSAGLGWLALLLQPVAYRSLWWAIGFHTSWDWAQSFLYGVADSGMMVQHHLLATHAVGKPILSGGATGPEGSIFVIAILALICLIIFLYPTKSAYGEATERSV